MIFKILRSGKHSTGSN